MVILYIIWTIASMIIIGATSALVYSHIKTFYGKESKESEKK